MLVAAFLAWYLSRRIVRPVLQLSDAADAVAAGHYDVTVPKRAPGELAHLSERFREMAGRLAEVELMERNFLMSVSHELRTPLTAIRGHVSALLEGVVDDPEQQQASLETVEAEATRLERLVGDILDLAKLDTHRFAVTREEVDMGTLLDQAYETYRDEARRRNIDYRREAPDRPVIISDGDRVLQVVGNLISNAFQATPDGGTRLTRARAAERLGACRGRGHRARASRRRSANGSSGRSSRSRAAAPGSASRSRRSCRPRSAAGSSSAPRSGKGSRFELVLPA